VLQLLRNMAYMIRARYYHYNFNVFVGKSGSELALNIILVFEKTDSETYVEPNIVHIFTINYFIVGSYFFSQIDVNQIYHKN